MTNRTGHCMFGPYPHVMTVVWAMITIDHCHFMRRMCLPHARRNEHGRGQHQQNDKDEPQNMSFGKAPNYALDRGSRSMVCHSMMTFTSRPTCRSVDTLRATDLTGRACAGVCP